MSKRLLTRATLIAVVILGLSIPARAALIQGTVGVGGGVIYDTLAGGLAVIDFAPLRPGPGGPFQPGVPGGPDAFGHGDLDILDFSQSGYFASIPNASFLNGWDMTNDPAQAGVIPVFGPALVLPGVDYGPAGVLDFLHSFSAPGFGALHFDLTQLLLQGPSTCGATLANGNSCVEGPFVITATAGGTRIDMDVLGFFRNGVQGCQGATCIDQGYFQGSYGLTFAGLSYTQLFNRLAAGQDLDCGVAHAPCVFSATFTNVVPEPATLLTLGTGVLLVARRLRRKGKKETIA